MFAPGSAADASRVDAGVAALSARGFEPVVKGDTSSSFKRTDRGFGSASAAERANSFHELLDDDSVDAILTVRGGYGTAQVLPLIDFNRVSQSGKLVVGYSDVTGLMLNIVARCGIPAVHGAFVAGEFADATAQADESVESLLSLLQREDIPRSYPARVVVAGEASGMLLAGNLSMLQTLLGTPWDVMYDGAILVIEDVNEAPYRIHRMLLQLAAAGKLENLAGLVFGDFSTCRSLTTPDMDWVINDIVLNYRGSSQYPVLADFPSGHTGRNVALPLGCRAVIRDGALHLVESPVG